MIIVKQGNDGRHVRFPKNRMLIQRERPRADLSCMDCRHLILFNQNAL
jgi:hypothetical protein